MCKCLRLLIQRFRSSKKKNESKSKSSKTKIGVNRGLKGSKEKCETDATKARKIEIGKGITDERTTNVIVINEINGSEIGQNQTNNVFTESENQIEFSKNQTQNIQLVANHLENEVNKTNYSSNAIEKTINQIEEQSKSKHKTSTKTKAYENSSFNSEEQKEKSIKANDCNSTSNTIRELNGNESFKPNEQLKDVKSWPKSELSYGKTANKKPLNVIETRNEMKESFATKPINKDSNALNLVSEKDMNISSDEKWVHSLINNESPKANLRDYGSATNKISSMNSVSNIIPIHSIDLKAAKCQICSILVMHTINITGCSHIYCRQCLHQWLNYSKHCPVCRSKISRFAHSIRIGSNDQICLRSEKDYKVAKVYMNEEEFVDSFGAAFLFEAFCLNYQNLKYLDFSIENISTKISYLESILLFSGDMDKDYVIQCQLKAQNKKLNELREKKMRAEEGLKDISHQINPEMLAFWRRAIDQRMVLNESQ